MKAKFNSLNVQNGRNYGDKKETIESMVANVVNKGDIVQPVTVRWYMSRSGDGASPVYCSVWIHGKGASMAGHGSAGGYGYCKRSAAMAEALKSAGVELYGDQYGRDNSPARNRQKTCISGVGMMAVEEAIKAIVRALGYRGVCRISRG
jgi:hypothetical protein